MSLECQAVVAEALPNARFLCRTDDGSEITCHVAGNARMEVVRVLPGEVVRIEPSPIDPSKGRIVGKPVAGKQGRQG
jgi:translation initiation factor IF-1